MSSAKIRVIITGSTGMVGEGVLHECLNSTDVEAVLIINRKSARTIHPKLTEIIHPDFADLKPIESKLTGYDTCFFCLGISSVGMKKEAYFKTTYLLTMHMAETLSRLNPGSNFCYVSGAGTSNAQPEAVNSQSNWSEVKGKTEHDLRMLPFKAAYAFRPGFIKPIPGLKNASKFYIYINWLFPLARAIYPAGFCTLHELGVAMIRVVTTNFPKRVIEGKDIIKLARGQ